jgi:hypothetical protein
MRHSDQAPRWRSGLLAVACAAVLAACGDPVAALLTDDCSDEMRATRSEFGEPQKITTAEPVGDWRIEIWSYFDRGFIRTFEWGEYARDCKVGDKPWPGR